ncbi:MAG TPA: HD-GYP domain-containing protein [Lachnospiraceae bacterium]|nr:HD-GYP domain-containing protein [Lachnospiraceae bacterium]
MKRIRTADLTPGMKTAEDVYSYNNQMILPKNTVLTDKMITRLEFYSVLAIKIQENDPFEADAAEVEEDEVEVTSSYSERVKSSKQFKAFEKKFLNETMSFEKNIRQIVEKNAPIDTNAMYRDVMSLISDNMNSITVFDMLHNMRQYDDFTYMHSINVALICNIFAKWLEFSPEEVETLTLCGLLHDIGKILIPDNIIKKPDRLSPAEYNVIKTHTLQGYNILMEYNINDAIKESALMHHERCDGSGYPLGLGEDRINKYAKIVAIADVYDAMTAARIYRGPLCPFKVISIFETEGLQKYDGKYILTFLEHIATTYMNNRVRLSNGKEGEVVFMNRNSLSKPMIKCGKTFIDLSKEPDIYIETFV